MDIIMKNQINITTFIILFFVTLIAFKKLEKTDDLNKAFIRTVIGVILGLFFESLSTFVNGHSHIVYIIINYISSIIIFSLAPMISFSFFIFIFRIVFPDKKLDKSILLIFSLPIVLNVILSFLSPFFGILFSISSQGVYSRGPLFLLSAFSTYLFLLLGDILVLINVKRIIRSDFWLILGIGIVPIIGGVIQSVLYGILTMWSSAGVALFLAYLFLQDRMVHLDSLTGVWNRESFYYKYSRRIQSRPDRDFGAIYLDIDNLKVINDHYGHLEGDNAIKLVLDSIKKILPNESIICRLGGDEFIILIEWTSEKQLTTLLNQIKNKFLQINQSNIKPYLLDCSFGAAIYTNKYISLNAFLSHLDKLMYQEKHLKKQVNS
ncbi:MAG: GGDEF domain-containing protein [Candidatus Izemoplasmatales bacterium]|uniref:GGDEF domain-containing protein n=1 Tax=Hujiaoplasma nucleasis TaxID=2725268 RepID=A0A7L6N672_9MOLU|nr:GGDEF domain-containing protein [Hujiaoplasma nucleasis]QLY40748.1 GGDEF domain-containing protein [Hujiaoplasma nucleasis]